MTQRKMKCQRPVLSKLQAMNTRHLIKKNKVQSKNKKHCTALRDDQCTIPVMTTTAEIPNVLKVWLAHSVTAGNYKHFFSFITDDDDTLGH